MYAVLWEAHNRPCEEWWCRSSRCACRAGTSTWDTGTPVTVGQPLPCVVEMEEDFTPCVRHRQELTSSSLSGCGRDKLSDPPSEQVAELVTLHFTGVRHVCNGAVAYVSTCVHGTALEEMCIGCLGSLTPWRASIKAFSQWGYSAWVQCEGQLWCRREGHQGAPS